MAPQAVHLSVDIAAWWTAAVLYTDGQRHPVTFDGQPRTPSGICLDPTTNTLIPAAAGLATAYQHPQGVRHRSAGSTAQRPHPRPDRRLRPDRRNVRAARVRRQHRLPAGRRRDHLARRHHPAGVGTTIPRPALRSRGHGRAAHPPHRHRSRSRSRDHLAGRRCHAPDRHLPARLRDRRPCTDDRHPRRRQHLHPAHRRRRPGPRRARHRPGPHRPRLATRPHQPANPRTGAGTRLADRRPDPPRPHRAGHPTPRADPATRALPGRRHRPRRPRRRRATPPPPPQRHHRPGPERRRPRP
jgi:hypothetical protein